MMAQRRTFVRSRDAHETPVFDLHVVEGQTDLQDIVVRRRVETPVGVPFNLRTTARRLHVQLRVMKLDVWPQKLLDDVQQPRVAHRRLVNRMPFVRLFDAPQLW